MLAGTATSSGSAIDVDFRLLFSVLRAIFAKKPPPREVDLFARIDQRNSYGSQRATSGLRSPLYRLFDCNVA